jgi:hypothetical protein
MISLGSMFWLKSIDQGRDECLTNNVYNKLEISADIKNVYSMIVQRQIIQVLINWTMSTCSLYLQFNSSSMFCSTDVPVDNPVSFLIKFD